MPVFEVKFSECINFQLVVVLYLEESSWKYSTFCYRQSLQQMIKGDISLGSFGALKPVKKMGFDMI